MPPSRLTHGIQRCIRYMAEQDQAHFAKEARYSSRRMNTRLAAKEEMASMASDGEVPAFLRRKVAQGKSQYRDGRGDKTPD